MSGNANDDDLMEKGGIMETSEDASGPNNLPSPKARESSHTTIVGALLPHILIQPREAKPHAPSKWRKYLLRPFTKVEESSNRDEDIPYPLKTWQRKLLSCPEGYPRLAAFLDSDENFMLYRRFGFLHARLLLYKQDELRRLEMELDNMDQTDAKENPIILQSRRKDDAEVGERKKLLQTIDLKLKEYAQSLITGRDLASFNKPPERDYWSVRSYFDEEKPLDDPECYIYYKEDVITLKPGRENAWLDAFIEKTISRFFCRFLERLFCPPDLIEKADTRNTRIKLLSRERMEIVASLIITMMILTLLVVPVWLLWWLTRNDKSAKNMAIIIVVLLAFTLAFSVVLTQFTRAQRHEILASAAAYCAVLVVFIGNVGSTS